jgi:hypothetical protein
MEDAVNTIELLGALDRIRETVDFACRHHRAVDMAASAQALSAHIQPSPLAMALHQASAQLLAVRRDIPSTLADATRVEAIGLAAILAHLDRCQHGRHQGDTCADCGGHSRGNPHLASEVIGYDHHGQPIVMPPRDRRRDPDAWHPRTVLEVV